MEGERSIPVRRAVLLGVPLLYVVLALLEPEPLGYVLGMALFLAGIAWLELRPRREAAGHAASRQGA